MNVLTQLRTVLSTQKRLSLNALAKACDTTVDEIESAVCFYVHKGCVRKKNLRLSCGTTCQQCDLSALVIYEWVNL